MNVAAGIDEAGYGPTLGPLVVTGCAFEVPEASKRGRDLWSLLSGAVVRSARGARGRLIVNDSKRVYSGPHGLRRLEESVLAFVGAGGDVPERLPGLLKRLGQNTDALGRYPWYARFGELALPLATNAAAVANSADVLSSCMSDAGVSVLGIWSSVINAGEFNEFVAKTRNKSSLVGMKCGAHMLRMWSNWGRSGVRLTVDRHGGKLSYLRLLRDAFPQAELKIVEQSRDCSSYRITDGERRLEVEFRPRAETHSLPVALASMCSKYLREVFMTMLNDYWSSHVEGLKSTAGYPKDAVRFLSDISAAKSGLGIDESLLVRLR